MLRVFVGGEVQLYCNTLLHIRHRSAAACSVLYVDFSLWIIRAALTNTSAAPVDVMGASYWLHCGDCKCTDVFHSMYDRKTCSHINTLLRNAHVEHLLSRFWTPLLFSRVSCRVACGHTLSCSNQINRVLSTSYLYHLQIDLH